jgi:ubiquinone/menaquinone biosynthesis C-methylase UbiE
VAGLARTPGHDVAFWELNLPGLAALLPEPGRAALDLGCGEGRFGRWLAEHGHRVSGIDSSRTLLAAAREAGGYAELVDGSAAALPWADGTFDLVLSCMSLQDMEDPGAAIAEAARVLAPGGILCSALPHPLGRPQEAMDDYFADYRLADTVTWSGLTMTFHRIERPLESFTGAMSDSGFVIEQLREPRPDEATVVRAPELEKAAHTPFFLHLRARLDR